MATRAAAEQHRFMMRCLLVTLLVAIGIAALVYYMVSHRPQSDYIGYFTEDNKLKYFRLNALSKPVVTRSALLQWAELAIISVNNYTAANYNEKLAEDTRVFFTEDGARAFLDELQNSNIFDSLVSKQLIVTAVAQGTPVMLKQGMLSMGAFTRLYTWKLQLPIMVTYQSPSDISRQNLLVTVLVVERPTWEAPEGIGIQQYWVAKA